MMVGLMVVATAALTERWMAESWEKMRAVWKVLHLAATMAYR